MTAHADRAPLWRDWLGLRQLRRLLRWLPLVLLLTALPLAAPLVSSQARPMATARIEIPQPPEPSYDETLGALIGELATARAPSAAAVAASPTLAVEPAREGGYVDVVIRADTREVATSVARWVAMGAVDQVVGETEPELARMRVRARVQRERIRELAAELAELDTAAADPATLLRRDASRSGLEAELGARRTTLAVLESDLVGLADRAPEPAAEVGAVVEGDPDALLGPLTVDDVAGAIGVALAASLAIAVVVPPVEPRRRLGPQPPSRPVAP